MDNTNNVVKVRVAQSYDTEENWDKKTDFIPHRGEIILYAPNGDVPLRMKVGDGTTQLAELPFLAFATENANTIKY